MYRIRFLALFGALTAAVASRAADGDWPQWRGPDRTGLSAETGLLKAWPPGGPKQAWKVAGLGDGYSTPTVANGRIYVMGTKGDGNKKDEYLIALNVKDGSRAWDFKMGKVAGGYPGPRCSPTVDGDRIYALGSDGKLSCVEAEKGQESWTKNLKSDFGGKAGGWAYTESPLIDGDVLVCTPGGNAAPIVALKKATGATVWKADLAGLPDGGKKGYTTAGYSSVVAATVHGVKEYVQFLTGGVVGVDAKTGKLLWHYEHPANGTANCSTPIVKDDTVLAASAYGTGGGRAKITAAGGGQKAEEMYFVKDLQNHHGGMVLVGDHVYGTGKGSLLCIDFKSGKIEWEEKGVGKGSITYADGHLYVRGERGDVALVAADPKGYREVGRFSQPDRSKQSAWPHPVVAGGRLYVRDWDVLLSYEVKDKLQ